MPANLSMTTVLFLFYGVFLCQILLVSLYYPAQIRRRTRYVLEHFSPEEYPKLYPEPFNWKAKQLKAGGMRPFLFINYGIAAIGACILVAMLASGYQPAPKGGDEVFVMLYFFLQAVPVMYVTIQEFRHYSLLRKNFSSRTRTAMLAPRRVVDFVSPKLIAAAVLLFILWLVFYLHDKGAVGEWGAEVYATLGGLTCLNFVYVFLIGSLVYGQKYDPYKATKDQMKQSKVLAHVYVFSSMGCSIFLTLSQLADSYAFEVFDPVLTSFYLQACVIFSMEFTLRNIVMEDIDFSVYRDQADAPQERAMKKG